MRIPRLLYHPPTFYYLLCPLLLHTLLINLIILALFGFFISRCSEYNLLSLSIKNISYKFSSLRKRSILFLKLVLMGLSRHWICFLAKTSLQFLLHLFLRQYCYCYSKVWRSTINRYLRKERQFQNLWKLNHRRSAFWIISEGILF